MRKKFSIVFVLMMTGQIFLSSFGMVAEALQTDESDSVFTPVMYVNENDEQVDPETYEGDVTAKVGWSLKNQEIPESGIEPIQLVEKFIVSEEQGELKSSDETVIGTYSVTTNGSVTVIFNDEAVDSDAEGTISIEGELPLLETPQVEDTSLVVDETTPTEEKEKEDEAKDNKTEDETKDNKTEDEIKDNKTEDNEQIEDEKHDEEVKNNENKINTLADEEKHGFTLKLSNATDTDGKHFDEDHQLGLDAEFKLDLEWDLEDGHNHVAGDVQVFQLPHGIKIQEEFEIELKSDGLDVAHAVIKTDGTVELTFTDFVETHSAVSGHMQIVAKIDESNAEVDDGDIVLKPIGDEGEIRIPIDLGERNKTIEKKGTPNKGYNADEINWEVTINKMKNDLKDAKVTDVLPAGVEFKEGSLKVTKLDVDLKGNIKGDLEEVTITGNSVVGRDLKIPLGDIKDAYRYSNPNTLLEWNKECYHVANEPIQSSIRK